MQKKFKINLIGLSVFLILGSWKASAFVDNQMLAKADSLFEQKKYSEALSIYQKIIAESNEKLPVLYLKAAFIEDGLNNYVSTLYYLNLYNKLHPDEKVLRKMDDMATSHQLKGYEFSDKTLIRSWYDKYYLYFAISCITIGIISLVFLVKRKINKNFTPIRRSSGLLILLLVFLLILNVGQDEKWAIIKNDNVYLMEAPSSGSQPLQIINKGHRLNARNDKDIWVEVEWEGQKAYVNKNQVWKIE